MSEETFFMISVAARRAGVHPQTIRVYEARGLIAPKRTPGKTRIYSEQDVRRLQRIQELTDLGVSLQAVRMVLEMEERLQELEARLKRQR
jgi:MerR family transcriptional regulator, heat shock protein HspR